MFSMTLGKALFIIGLLVSLVALGIRYPLHIYTQMSEGKTFLEALAHMFSFFTIIMNTLVLLVYLAHVKFFSQKLAFFRKPVIMATAVAGILIVMIVYHVLLSATHHPTGIFILTNILQHYIAPVIFPLWWLFAGRSGTMKWSHIPYMVIIPVLYLAWVFTRGAITNLYPYKFLNIAEKGVAGVAPTLLAITLLFIIFGAILTLLDRKKPENL